MCVFHRTEERDELLPFLSEGLALSKRLAEALGGSLTAYSVREQGTTFAVDLLAAEGPLEQGQPVPAAAPELGPDPGPVPSAT